MGTERQSANQSPFANYYELYIGGPDGELHPPETRSVVAEVRSLLRRLEVGDRVVYTTPSNRTVDPVTVTGISRYKEAEGERVEVTIEGPDGGLYRLVDDPEEDRPHVRYAPQGGTGGRRGPISAIVLVAGSTQR